MRKQHIITVALLAACAAAVAGTYFGKRLWAKPQPPTTLSSQAHGDNPFVFAVDYPPIVCRDASNPVPFEVPVVNRSENVTRFQNFACDCGCTSGGLDHEELQPGESAKVRMAVNLSGREGAQRFACHWNDESGTRWTAETRVTIYKPAQFDPGTVRLGKVAPGDAIKKRVHYDEYVTTEAELSPVPNFSISSIHRNRVQLERHPPVVEHLGAGLIHRRTALDVTFPVANRGGYDEVFLVPSGPPLAGQSTQSLRIDWSVPETVELSPARIALTFAAKGEDRRAEVVRVRPIDGRAFAIEKVTSSDACIQARVLVAPSSSAEDAEIEVSVALAEGKRILAGEVVLHLASPDSREVRLPVTAFRVERVGMGECP